MKETEASEFSGRVRRFARRWLELRGLDALAARGSWLDLATAVSDVDYPRSREFFALQRPSEIAALAERVAELRPRAVLEIGTAGGGTLYLLCRASTSGARIVSIDLPGGEFGGGYTPDRSFFYRRFRRRGQKVTLIRDDSHADRTLARVDAIFGGRESIDLVFVDGDHSLEGAQADYESYWPYLRSGGLMAFHDINSNDSPWGGHVPEVWQRVRTRARSEELIEGQPGSGFGIGLLWKS